MKKLLILVLLFMPLGVFAQDDYTQGTYWTVSSIDTNDGKFNDYITDLNNGWKKSLDIQIKEGLVVSYKVFGNVNARVGEPDLFLMIEWKSGAAMLDQTQEYWDDHAKKLWGSQEAGEAAGEERGKIRTLMSDTLLREISFK